MHLAVALKKKEKKKKIPAYPRIRLYKDGFCHLVEVFLLKAVFISSFLLVALSLPCSSSRMGTSSGCVDALCRSKELS